MGRFRGGASSRFSGPLRRSGRGTSEKNDSIGPAESQIVPHLEFALELPGVTQRTLWDFHADLSVLERLTPREMDLKIVERPERLARGARVVLDLRRFGLRLRWVSLFSEWEPPRRFVDVQEEGPFASWQHEHLFSDGRLVDRIAYQVPLARLGGGLVDRLFVSRDVARLFAHRHRVTREELLR